MNKSRNPILILIGGLLVGAGLGMMILLWTGFGERWLGGGTPSLGGGSVPSAAVDQPAPDFELETLSGESLRLSELRGRPVLINFWATWCAPCVLEMPTIEKYYDQYSQQFSVLAVNNDEPAGEVANFVQEMGLSFDILLDPGAKVQNLYRLRGYPTSIVVDAEGILRVQHIGPLSERQLEGYLSKVGVGQ
jgi:thiol-disulfide isomerase/thioredoxin